MSNYHKSHEKKEIRLVFKMVNIGVLLQCLKNFGIIASVYYEPTRDHFDIIIGHHNVSEYEKNTDLANQCVTDNFNFTSINVASYTSLLGGGFLNDEQRQRHDVSLFDGLPSIEEVTRESINQREMYWKVEFM